MLSAEMADNSPGVKHLERNSILALNHKNNYYSSGFSQEQMGGTWDSTLIIPKKSVFCFNQAE